MHNILQYFNEKLCGIYSRNEIQSICFQIMQEVCGCSKAALFANNGIQLDDKQKNKIDNFIGRLVNNEPIQYVVGHCHFFDIILNVNKNVLIPRPETEELVEWILTDNPQKEASILDICTGSGCIAITIKKYKQNFDVTASDISSDAISVAKNNAMNNDCLINFKCDNILKTQLPCSENYDIIVSNPPYVTEKEKGFIKPNVLDYEPHLALFVPNEDPLMFYKQISVYATKALKKGGKLYFEINEAYGEDCVKLLSELGFLNVTLKKDIFGKDRMIRAQKNF